MRPFVAWCLLAGLPHVRSRDEIRREKDGKPHWGPKAQSGPKFSAHSSQQRSVALSANGQVEHRQRWGPDPDAMIRRIKEHRLEAEKEHQRHEAAVERDLRKDGYPMTADVLKKYQHPSKEAGPEGAMAELLLRYEKAQREAAVLGELLEKSEGDNKRGEFGPAVDTVHHLLEHHPVLAIVLGILLGVAIGLACLLIYHLLQHKKFKSLRLATQGVAGVANTAVEKQSKAESVSTDPSAQQAAGETSS